MYAGLNAGYNWGTNANAYSQNYGTFVTPAGVAFNSNNAIVPVAMDGVASNTQSGFIGGAQFGYNYQYGTSFILGVETDISGSNSRGSGRTNGAAAGAYSGLAGTVPLNLNVTAFGSTGVQAGLDYLGTVRGRIGYLWSPSLMIYGTGGFAYGGAWANVVQTATAADTIQGFTQTGVWNGAGQQNQLLVGWTAGGGAEWMFMPNWSLKGEALYWDLGRMNIQTTSYSSAGNGIGWGRTNVNYAGVAARAGINYHFNWGTAPIVAKF
jgi:outer membrane immunogenic protein